MKSREWNNKAYYGIIRYIISKHQGPTEKLKIIAEFLQIQCKHCKGGKIRYK